MWEKIVWLAGIIAVARLVFWVFTLIWQRLLRPPVDLRPFGAKSGAWAVVTGASDGIGKAYAIELAKRGFNVFLISRTQSKLESLAKGIREKYKVEADILAFDCGTHDYSTYDAIKVALDNYKNIGILVNNVGVSYPFPVKFLDVDEATEDSILTVNIKSMTIMTRLVLPHLIRRKKGAIINLSSFAGMVPAPLLAIYSGSKAYVDHFSISLDYEYKNNGVTVQSVTPGLTVSNMSKIRYPSLTRGVCNPDIIARGSLNNVGREFRWNPWWMHALIEYVFSRGLPEGYSYQKLQEINLRTSNIALSKSGKSIKVH